MASPTIVDIARLAGVSFKTVARVINREPLVKAETRERVEAVIARLKYRPNVWARTLRSSHSHVISLIVSYSRDPRLAATFNSADRGKLDAIAASYYFHQTHIAALTVCQRQGYHLFMEEVSVRGRELEQLVRETIKSTQPDGILLVPPVCDDLSLLKLLQAEHVSFVRLGPTKHLEIAPYVYIDDREAAYQETRLLCELGHQDIGFVKGPDDHGSSEVRYRGFVAAMTEWGRRVNPELCAKVDYSNAKMGMEAGDILLAKRPRPSAIVAFNDELAIGVMSAAMRRGLKVPEDISVVGFDDSPLASMIWPSLTTIHHPIAAMVQRAGEMLIDEIEDKGTARTERFEFDLVIRESTAPPHGGQKRSSAGPRKRSARKT